MSKLSVRVFTAEFRGDHAADICEQHEIQLGETVEALAERILNRGRGTHDSSKFADWIEIKFVVEAR